ncbi:MAG: 2-isopropylmalate synthase [Chloroflexi bacterium HGW-Chloroflexi-3]|nr:MAG: 2-isopropylmalate synthase [Chloroflexi bacterium HGW-Chloroflexi-3]
MQDQYVRIFDTTLRDGEQSPGASLTSNEKLMIARALARMNVDVIEAGFPAASPDDLAAVKKIAMEVGNPQPGQGHKVPIICGLARASQKDIDAAWEAVQHAQKARIHTFLATSPIHMKYKLKMEPQAVLQRVEEMVSYARSLCTDIEFSPEDAGRSEAKFLYQVLEVAIKAGATTLNIPDTVGYTIPEEFGALIAGIRKNVTGIDGVILSVHCHDDLGLATANTIAGIQAGARQAEVTINGIGERAGNTSHEEVVMALNTRRQVFDLETGIDTTQLTRISRLVSTLTGIPVQPNKAIVGANAFAHEAGIHQDGMLKHQETYEIMRPDMVGEVQSRLVLGKHSGRHAFKKNMETLGFELNESDLEQAFERFKNLADNKKNITEADLEAIISDQIYQPLEVFRLEGLQVSCGTMGMPTATVRLRDINGKEYINAALGTGPVDAVFTAINQVVKVTNTLLEYNVNSITEGIDAMGHVSVRLQAENGSTLKRQSPQNNQLSQRTFGGHGVDTDIIVASAKAFLSGLNKILVASGKHDPAQSKENNQPVKDYYEKFAV